MKYVWHAGGWVRCERITPISPGLSPAIHSDHMDPLRHMATGEIFDSKSRFREATRASGCLELGNDASVTTKPRQTDRKQLRNDIHQAISELEAGRPAPTATIYEGSVRRYDA